MYSYEQEKPRIFTEDGQLLFLRIRDNAARLLAASGAARMDKILSGVTGDSWNMLACVDRLVEIGELREIEQGGRVAGQDRIFVRT